MRQQRLTPMPSGEGEDPSSEFCRLAKEFRERRSLVHATTRSPPPITSRTTTCAAATTQPVATTTALTTEKQPKTVLLPGVAPNTNCCAVSLPKIGIPEQEEEKEQEQDGKLRVVAGRRQSNKDESSLAVVAGRRRSSPRKKRRPFHRVRATSSARNTAIHDDDVQHHHYHHHHHHHDNNSVRHATRNKNHRGDCGVDDEEINPCHLLGGAAASRAFGPPHKNNDGGMISVESGGVGMMTSSSAAVSGIRSIYRARHDEQQQEGSKNRATLDNVRRLRRRRRRLGCRPEIATPLPVLSCAPLCERQAGIVSTRTEYNQRQPETTNGAAFMLELSEKASVGDVGAGAGDHSRCLIETSWRGDHPLAAGIGGSHRHSSCASSSSGSGDNNIVGKGYQAAGSDEEDVSTLSSRKGDAAATSAIRGEPRWACRPVQGALCREKEEQTQQQGAVFDHLDWRRALLDHSYEADLVRDLKQALRAGRSVVLRAREDQPALGYTDRADCQLMLRTLYMQCVRVSIFRLRSCTYRGVVDDALTFIPFDLIIVWRHKKNEK